MAMHKIVDALEDNVESSASDVRRTLYSTINNLKATGFVHVADGKVELTAEGLKEAGK